MEYNSGSNWVSNWRAWGITILCWIFDIIFTFFSLSLLHFWHVAYKFACKTLSGFFYAVSHHFTEHLQKKRKKRTKQNTNSIPHWIRLEEINLKVYPNFSISCSSGSLFYLFFFTYLIFLKQWKNSEQCFAIKL